MEILTQYLKDVFLGWIGVIGIVLTVLSVAQPTLEDWLKRTIRFRYLWAVALGCFAVAGYQAWKDEYVKTHPQIHLAIEEYGFNSTENGPTTAMVIASAANVGSTPSVVDSWTLQVTPPGGQAITLPFFRVSQDLPIRFYSGHGEATYKPSDMLYMKGGTTPIPEGGKISGMLFYAVVVPRESIDVAGTTFHLCAKDVAGNQICAPDRAMDGHGSTAYPYIPGIEPSIKPE